MPDQALQVATDPGKALQEALRSLLRVGMTRLLSPPRRHVVRLAAQEPDAGSGLSVRPVSCCTHELQHQRAAAPPSCCTNKMVHLLSCRTPLSFCRLQV